jgi:iron complex outermembrane receptor protein
MAETKINDTFKLKGNVFYDKYYNVLDSYTNDTYSILAAGYPSIYDDYSQGFSLMPGIDLKKFGELDFSFTSKYDRHRSQDGGDASWKVFSARTSSAGAEYNLSINPRLKLLFGLIYEYFDPDEANGGERKPSIDILNPQAGISFDLGQNSIISAKVGQRSRFPTLKDLYSDKLGDYRPNPDLKAEKAMHYELGFKKIFSNENEVNLNLFRSDVDDLIERGRDPSGVYTYQMQNLNKVIFQGVELDIKFKLHPRLLLSPYYHYLYTKNISVGKTSPYLEYRPRYTTGLNIKLEAFKDFFTYLDVNYVSWQSYRDANVTAQDEWSTLGGYAKVDLKLEKSITKFASAWFRVENLLDRNYEGEKGFPEPGRTLFLGFRLQWG